MKNKNSDKILASAKAILATNGAAALTMREIAKGAGVALGTTYNYFANKDEIVLALVEDFWSRAVAKTAELPAQSSFSQEYRLFYEILLSEFSSFQQDWLSLLKSMKNQEKTEGRRRELEIQSQLYCQVYAMLERYFFDETAGISRENFARYITESTFGFLVLNKTDISVFLDVVQLVLDRENQDNIVYL